MKTEAEVMKTHKNAQFYFLFPDLSMEFIISNSITNLNIR